MPVFSTLLQQAGVPAEAFDARGLIVTKEEADFALVDFVETKKKCQTLTDALRMGTVPVVTRLHLLNTRRHHPLRWGAGGSVIPPPFWASPSMPTNSDLDGRGWRDDSRPADRSGSPRSFPEFHTRKRLRCPISERRCCTRKR